MSDQINELFDKDGNLLGALLSADAWKIVKESVYSNLGLKDTDQEKLQPEPLSDWETLKQYWDFKYPVDTDVQCENCGNSTQDWIADTPRLFRLTSANLAGLVAFQCMHCKAKVVKKHFNTEIKTECTPFQNDKIKYKEGRY